MIVKVYLQHIVKIQFWRTAILLIRFASFVAVAMAVPEISIFSEINLQPWADLMAVMADVVPILY